MRCFMVKRMLTVIMFLLIVVPDSFSFAVNEEKQPHEEWTARISPGIRGGNGRTLYYVDGLIPFFRKKNSLFFANPRAVFGSNDTEEVNLGFGYRHLLYDDRMFWGINGYFDTQRSENNLRHNQVGFGLEAIVTEWIDFRSNFYFPVSGKKTISEGTRYRFAQRSFLSYRGTNYEEPLPGLDYEGGVLIPGISDIIETRVYLGGYYYDSEIEDDINGIKGRIEIRPFPPLSINFEIKDDNAFGTDILVGGCLSIPIPFKGWEYYRKKRGKRKPRERMTDLVVRDIDVVSKKSTRESNTQKIYDMVYVDNKNTTGIEDGSLDHPYDTMTEGLSALSDSQTMYVFRGNGNYTGNFTVSNENTIIWGEGYEAFPGCGGECYPVLDGNNSGNVFTVSADNVEIRGLKIQNSGGSHAGLYALNVSGGNIHHNVITGNRDNVYVLIDGGVLVAGGDTKDILGAQNAAPVEITSVDHGFVNGDAVKITEVEGMVELNSNVYEVVVIDANRFSLRDIDTSIPIDSSAFSVYVSGGKAEEKIAKTVSGWTVSNNIISQGVRNGVLIYSDFSTVSGFAITDNTVSGSGEHGIYVVNDGNSTISDFTFTNNTMTGNKRAIGIIDYGLNPTFSNVNFGDASAGTGGYNSIYNSLAEDFQNQSSGSFKAENNYWGGGEPTLPAGVDYKPYLTTDPN